MHFQFLTGRSVNKRYVRDFFAFNTILTEKLSGQYRTKLVLKMR